MPNANIDKRWRVWKLFHLCLSWHSPVSSHVLSKHLSDAFSCWADVVDPLICNRESRWNEAEEEELEETNNYPDTFTFCSVFRPNMKIEMRMMVHGARMLPVMLSDWRFCSLSKCRNPMGSKSETISLMKSDSSGHGVQLQISSDHVRSVNTRQMLRWSWICCRFGSILITFHVSPIPFPQIVDQSGRTEFMESLILCKHGTCKLFLREEFCSLTERLQSCEDLNV